MGLFLTLRKIDVFAKIGKGVLDYSVFSSVSGCSEGLQGNFFLDPAGHRDDELSGEVFLEHNSVQPTSVWGGHPAQLSLTHQSTLAGTCGT